jgi:cholesterol transport system auxiliary component
VTSLWPSCATAAFGLAIAVAPVCGCALLSRGATLDIHWYNPELASMAAGKAEMQEGRELRLGRVSSTSALGLRVAFGDGMYEVGFHDARRWTERPEHYVRRALDRALFEEGGFRRGLGNAGPSLDVDVLDFEEVRAPTTHAARIALHLVLSTDRVLLERTITISEPAADTFEAFVAAMATALKESAAEVSGAVGKALDAGEATGAAR